VCFDLEVNCNTNSYINTGILSVIYLTNEAYLAVLQYLLVLCVNRIITGFSIYSFTVSEMRKVSK